MKKLLVVCFSILVSFSALAEKPILIIGASYANASTPINDNLEAPLGGTSVAFGSFLSLGNALVRDPRLSGHVINEAQAGATTFARMGCNPTCSPGIGWQSMDDQLTKALKRVYVPSSGEFNADFVIIASSNDCLHSDAFGIAMTDTAPCTYAQMQQHADRMVALGQRIVAAGLTPIYAIAPDYDDLDLTLFGQNAAMVWTIGKSDYDQLHAITSQRIADEVPGAVQLDIWRQFTHIGDGIHPDQKTAIRAARVIARYIKKHSS